MNKSLIKIVFTDLDGTLLNSTQRIGSRDLEMLHKLEKQNIVRVIVTGRNLYSLKKVIPDDFPVDYIIFSTGAGILEWKTKQLIYVRNLEKKQIDHVADLLMDQKINFMLHKKVPENHQFYYFFNNVVLEDFQRRMDLYRDHSTQIGNDEINQASQFLVVFEKMKDFNFIKDQLKQVKIVRATSPLDYKSIWMEIFHKEVSKQKGCCWLCNHLSIEQKHTISFGNDFNDADMLAWTEYSYVVANGVDQLKKKYKITKNHNENGLSEILLQMFN